MSSKSIHIVAYGKQFFPMTMYSLYICMYMYISHLLYPFICWWTLRLLHILATVNNTAKNIEVHVSFWICAFLSRYIPRIRVSGSYGNSGLFFKAVSTLLSTVSAAIYIPTNSNMKVPFTLHPQQHFSLMMAILTGERWYLTVVLLSVSLMIGHVFHHQTKI